jgi:hypothetical protein
MKPFNHYFKSVTTIKNCGNAVVTEQETYKSSPDGTLDNTVTTLPLLPQERVNLQQKDIAKDINVAVSTKEKILATYLEQEVTEKGNAPKVAAGELSSDSVSVTSDFSPAVLEAFYPENVPFEICRGIIAELKQQPNDYQKTWWLNLSKWLTNGTGDIEWRCRVFEQLSDCWDNQPRPDFELAKKMFRGIGSRFIADGAVFRNER